MCKLMRQFTRHVLIFVCLNKWQSMFLFWFFTHQEITESTDCLLKHVQVTHTCVLCTFVCARDAHIVHACPMREANSAHMQALYVCTHRKRTHTRTHTNTHTHTHTHTHTQETHSLGGREEQLRYRNRAPAAAPTRTAAAAAATTTAAR